MAMIDRAAQFSPFAALSGHGAAIRETARLTDQRVELDETRKAELDENLQYVVAHPSECPTVTIVYFLADTKKAGGSYVSATGAIKRIEIVDRMVLMADGTQIPVDDIYDVESDCLHSLLHAEGNEEDTHGGIF